MSRSKKRFLPRLAHVFKNFDYENDLRLKCVRARFPQTGIIPPESYSYEFMVTPNERRFSKRMMRRRNRREMKQEMAQDF